jgi:uroporphyrinogen decarboxylase
MKYDIRKIKREPDFKNLLAVLEGKAPSRPTLFEFFMNDPLYSFLLDQNGLVYSNINEYYMQRAKAYRIAGYDYITVLASDLIFNSNDPHEKETKSLNDATMITDRKSFDAFEWPDASAYDYSRLDYIGSRLPEGMKIIPYGPGGVLENAVSLMGYDNLCYALFDDPWLVRNMFDRIGSTLVDYYKLVSYRDDVGAVISNDDWGFNTQPMISETHLREYVIPWHKEIVRIIHDAGKPAILHSCGNVEHVMDDIIKIGYEAKHSYEDNIIPVEEFYPRYNGRIAVLGGIDLDFVCRSTPDEIYTRSRKMVDSSPSGYALGSGNSIPQYVPVENYMAMIAAAYG